MLDLLESQKSYTMYVMMYVCSYMFVHVCVFVQVAFTHKWPFAHRTIPSALKSHPLNPKHFSNRKINAGNMGLFIPVAWVEQVSLSIKL